jgi:hypothetical protein
LSNKFTKLLVILTLSAILVAGCASTEPQADAAPALQVTGKVANESGWTEDQLKAMDTVEVEATSKSGEVNTYTGVLITSLLDEAQLASDASTLFLVGDDGYEAEATLEEIQACANCIVAFQDEGGLRSVLPDFPGNMQVKGLVELRVE